MPIDTSLDREKKLPFQDFPTPFEWCKGRGKLTEAGRGIAFGMHLSGVPVAKIADAMNMTRKGVYKALQAMRDELQMTTPERVTPHTPQDKVAHAQCGMVEEMVAEKVDVDQNVIPSSPELRKRIREEAPE